MKLRLLSRNFIGACALFLSIFLTATSPSLASGELDKMSSGSARLRELGAEFSVDVPVHKIQGARLVLFNRKIAKDLGIEVPDDFAELEKMILDRFAYMVTSGNEPVDKIWQASYYQDSDKREPGEAIGDGRALWTGELGDLDVQVKGIGQTPLAWFNHSQEAHRDGLQSMREAVHSFVMSELNYLNQLNTTVDLAVIEIPTTKKDHRGRMEKSAITIRVGEQFRIAHLRYWSGDKERFKRILDLAVRQTLKLAPEIKITSDLYQKYLEQLAVNLADEAARYYDLHAVHGSPTTGNRTFSGATIDLGTFRYLDAHHSWYTYLFDKKFLGGERGQVNQLKDYLTYVSNYINASGGSVDLQAAKTKFQNFFEVELTNLWLARLGLVEDQIKKVNLDTRKKLFETMIHIHEAASTSEVKTGSKTLHSALFKPRVIFKKAWEAMLPFRLFQKTALRNLMISTTPPESTQEEKSKAIKYSDELLQSLRLIERDLNLTKNQKRELLARASLSPDRDPLGEELGQAREKVILEKIQSESDSGEVISAIADKVARDQADQNLLKNTIRNWHPVISAPVTCEAVFKKTG